MFGSDVEHLFGASIRKRAPPRGGRHVSRRVHDEENQLRVAGVQLRGRQLPSVVPSFGRLAAKGKRLRREELRGRFDMPERHFQVTAEAACSGYCATGYCYGALGRCEQPRA